MRLRHLLAATLGVVALASIALVVQRASGDSDGGTPEALIALGPIDIPIDQFAQGSLSNPSFDVPAASDPSNSFQLVLTNEAPFVFDLVRIVLNGADVFHAPVAPSLGDARGVPPANSYVVAVALRATGNSIDVTLRGFPNTTARLQLECVPRPAVNARAFQLRTLCIPTAYVGRDVDCIIALRNDNDGATLGARLLLYAPDGSLVTTTGIFTIAPDERRHISLTKVLLTAGGPWTRGSIIVQVIGRAPSNVCADAIQANRKDIDSATSEFKGKVPGTARNLPVVDRGAAPITPELAAQLLGG